MLRLPFQRAAAAAWVVGICAMGPAIAQDTKLAGAAAASVLIGNTLDGNVDKLGPTVVYLDPGGQVRILQRGTSEYGTWSFTATDLCLDFHKGVGLECIHIEVAGSRAKISDDGATLGTLDILKGNAKNL
jgi:hypothetical protein